MTEVAAKTLVQQQFGANAAAYATSAVHAKGASLARLVELVKPGADWSVLDIATGAGHRIPMTHIWSSARRSTTTTGAATRRTAAGSTKCSTSRSSVR